MFKKLVKTKVVAMTVVILLTFGVFTGYSSGNKQNGKANTNKTEIKNIIFMIGDGMGNHAMSAHRYMKDKPSTDRVENTAFDPYLIGMQTTYADDADQNITDSASAATAMSSGVKTYNSAVAVDANKKEVKTVLEAAKESGKSTGLVATSELTHATPASYGAHDESRRNMDEIANDYYDELINGEHKVDVMLGGGLNNFIRKDRNLTKEFKKDGYSYVTTKQQLLADKNNRILGLFADAGLPKMIDRPIEIPSLKEMSNTAIKKLSKNKNGFFLMIEGSQIDWGAHDNDVVATMSEMEDFEQAFKAVMEFVKKDKETLIVVTADHSTGGFTMGANGVYNWFPESIQNAKRTPDFMAAEIVAGKNVESVLNQYSGIKLSSEELESVKMEATPDNGIVDEERIDNSIEKLYDIRSNSGWTTTGHTGEDVAVYAYGPHKDLFAGHIDNTDHAKIIFDLIKDKKEGTN